MKSLASVFALAAALVLATGAQAQQPSAPPPAAPPGPSGGPGGGDFLIDASSVVGSTVRASDGKDLGKVDRLMIDPRDGRVRTVVISMGGTLGMGGKTVSMPWESVRLARDGDKLVVVGDPQGLEQAPSASPPSDSKSGQKPQSPPQNQK